MSSLVPPLVVQITQDNVWAQHANLKRLQTYAEVKRMEHEQAIKRVHEQLNSLITLAAFLQEHNPTAHSHGWKAELGLPDGDGYYKEGVFVPIHRDDDA